MATTGLLLIQLNSLISSSHLSRIISTAVKKIEKNLYIKVQISSSDSQHENSVQSFNNLADEIYSISSIIGGKLDSRVILSDFRDSLFHVRESQNPLYTNHKIQLILSSSGRSNSILNQLLNKDDDASIEEFEFTEANEPETNEPLTLQNSKKIEIENQANPNSMYDNVVLGGTFDRLHAGHKMLLSAAILRCKKRLTVGVTDGAMINSKKLWEIIEPCELRMKNLKDFLMDVEPRLEYSIVPITDPYGPTAYDPDLELLVVSEETLKGGLKVNQLRKEKGLKILDVYPIPLINDRHASKWEENKISSSSIRIRLLGSYIKPPTKKSRPYVIGLTGGIASGKTSICRRLKDLGAHVISCDRLGHLAYKKGTKCYQEMVDYFGTTILDCNFEIDRKKLGPIVFSDKAQLNKLNSMVWPEIRRLYQTEIQQLKDDGFDGVVVLDAAILLEAEWNEDCNEVWVSIIPPSEAVQRIAERDKLTSEEATKRIGSQLSNSQRLARANLVLCSQWEPDVTALQVQTAWKNLQQHLSSEK